jgi:hypothetical protein
MRRLRGGCERVPWGCGEGGGDGDGSAMVRCAVSGQRLRELTLTKIL